MLSNVRIIRDYSRNIKKIARFFQIIRTLPAFCVIILSFFKNLITPGGILLKYFAVIIFLDFSRALKYNDLKFTFRR